MSNIFVQFILDTSRQGRMSELVAKRVYDKGEKWNGVETKFIDIRQIKFSTDDAGESIKKAEFSATCNRALWIYDRYCFFPLFPISYFL